MDSPNLSLAPPGMPPQFYPHYQSHPTKFDNDSLRKIMGGRVESHKRPRRVRGYGRNHTEPQIEHSTRTIEAISPSFSPSLTGNTISSKSQAPTRTTGLLGSPYASLQSRFPHSSDVDFTSLRSAPQGYNRSPTVSERESQLPTPMYSRHPSPGAGAFWDPVQEIYAPRRHSRSLAASAGEEAPTPTLSTPITPMHAKSFNPTRQPQQSPQQPLQAQAPDQQPIDNNAPFGDLTKSSFDIGLNFGDGDDALKDFDFDSFLNTGEDSGGIGGVVGFDDFTDAVEAGDSTVVDEVRKSKAAEPMFQKQYDYMEYNKFLSQGPAAFERPKKKSNAIAINNSDGEMLDHFHPATVETNRQDALPSFPDYKRIGVVGQMYLPPKIGMKIKHTISEDDTVDEIRQQKSLLALQRPSVFTFMLPKDWRT